MHTIARTHTPHLTRATALFAGVIVLSVFLYGFFLLEAVGNTAQRTHAEREIRALTSSLSSLEQGYLAHTRKVTLARAQELGFVVPAKVTTVFMSADSQALSLNH